MKTSGFAMALQDVVGAGPDFTLGDHKRGLEAVRGPDQGDWQNRILGARRSVVDGFSRA